MSYASKPLVVDGDGDALMMDTQSEDRRGSFRSPPFAPRYSFPPQSDPGLIYSSPFPSFSRVPAAAEQQHRRNPATSNPNTRTDQPPAGDRPVHNRHPSTPGPFGDFRHLPVPPGYPFILPLPQRSAIYGPGYRPTDAATRLILAPPPHIPISFPRIEEGHHRSTRSGTPPPLTPAFRTNSTAMETNRPSPRSERSLDAPFPLRQDMNQGRSQGSVTQGRSLRQSPQTRQSTPSSTFTLRTRDSLELIEGGTWNQSSSEKILSTEADMLNDSDDSATSTASRIPRLLRDDLTASPPAPRIYGIVENNAGQHAQAQRAFHRRRMSRPPNPNRRLFPCTACMDDFNRDDLLNIGCGCRYCQECLKDAFEAGCANMASFPPKCCGKALRISVWGGMLERGLVDRYKQIEAEFTANRPLYCAYAHCSAFLPENNHLADHEVGVCFKCERVTCKRCRRLMDEHQEGIWDADERICPKEDDNEAALYALGSEKRWKQCPTCLTMVERTDGCNHMDCICGVEFCYRCGRLFDEDDSCECAPGSWQDDEDEENGENEDEDESDGEDWPDFRRAVDPAGRPACFHRHTSALGEGFLACHGCLEHKPLHSCEACGLELCMGCLENVRSRVDVSPGTRARTPSSAIEVVVPPMVHQDLDRGRGWGHLRP
ncbi:hypothetical protein PV05_11276 [Exophiala xenobiotica]|uniref:RBR-type E3 ubiquitin transferase n=1 Tax=Exophiala xenobiotica TaxID=348802 RepID=A0A0D2EP71_9EURO|nr:uncharacterized protein PV05_11276 [Exophiala xenobiotica]KIW49609.1 hypothetical protein PV05_11276 [Exophiala xenobiotica]